MLTARLVELKPSPPKAEPPPQAQPQPPQTHPRPKAAATPQSMPQRPASISPVEAPRAAPEAPVVAPPPVAAPAPAVPAPPPASKAEARAATGASVSPEADTLAQYRLEIIELARRYKRYPRVAQDNNWTGTASVRMVIAADGAIESLAVRTSSGYAVLDQEAMAMLRTAKSKATIPAALRGKTITLDVPVIFNIKDEGG